MSINEEEFIRDLIKGIRIFEDVEISRGFDFTPFVSKINDVLQKSTEDKVLMIDGGKFVDIKAEGIYLRKMNTLWEPERSLLFVGSNLRKADLKGANLKNADFTNADLSNACLEKADLKNAVLHHADLSVAKIANADLSGADLSAANLEGANLIDANLSDTCLANANIHKADLTGVEFFNSDLRNADLSGTVLTCSCGSADFTDVNLEKALLKEVEFTHSLFIRAWLKKAVVEDSSLYKIDFSDCMAKEAVFRHVYAEHLDFCNADLKGVDFTGSEFHRVDFTGADLRNANLDQVTLEGVYFYRTDLRGVKNLESVKGFERAILVEVFVTSEQAEVFRKRLKNSQQNEFIVKEVK